MACQGCINRQRKLVARFCKNPDSRWCIKAQARLDRMLSQAAAEAVAPSARSKT